MGLIRDLGARHPHYDRDRYSIPNGCNFGVVASADLDKTTMFTNNNNKQTTTQCGGMFTFYSVKKMTKTTMAAYKVSEEELDDMRRK